jgi:hypothetical protein
MRTPGRGWHPRSGSERNSCVDRLLTAVAAEPFLEGAMRVLHTIFRQLVL